MTVLENILSQEIVQKIGWTLLHFIWQAAVLAILLAILLRLLRKSTPSLRYIIACLALALIVLLPAVTIQLVPVSVTQMAIHIEPAPAPAVLATEEIPIAETIVLEKPVQLDSVAPVSADFWKQRAVATLEPALPYIVSGWLVGVFGLSLWHLGGWTQLQRLKRRMVKQVDDTLHSKLKVLAQRLKVKQTVQLMESALVQIPTVVGWLRPVILLPASALTGLSSEQLEAILAHELAHIKRFDYLLNILQTIVEILGFYHPAVWWVSHKIRTERENCCDDLAVGILGDRVCYARALTSMEEIRAGRGQLAVAASGGNLSKRICRLVGKDSAEKTGFSWIPATTAILLILALVIPTTLALTTNRTDDQSNTNLETILLDGFRENRSKFKCGLLAWTRKTINDGFGGPVKDKYETEGSFQLWWDGKKIATKYVDERVFTDRTGQRWRIEAQTGGNAYDGSLLSRKPKFRLYENWFEEVIRWTGALPPDKDISTMKKLRYVSLDWSIIEVEGKKQIKLIIKNLKDGASGIRYFDLSRGCNQVRRESYNAQGQLCNRETRKLQQVSGGGWFPVEVDMKSTNREGKVTLHQRFVLDMKRCSFNEPSAIPDGIFEFSTAKEEEQLNKILEKFSNRAPAGPADKSDNNCKSIRESVENFIAAALAGEDEKAETFAYPDTAVAEQIDDTREALQGQQVRIVGICAGDWSALAISSVIQGDHGRIGPLLFHTKKVILDQKVHWLIDDIDLETLDTIEPEIKRFIERNPEAKTVIVTSRRPMVSPDLSAGKETDVSVEDDILLATEQEKELSANRFPISVPAKSPATSVQDKTIIQVDCLIVEVSLDSKMDRETTIMAENLLGNKISLRDTKLDVLLRKAAAATAATKDKSAENKRVTQDQFKALVDMLTSKGYLKILMNPTIETFNGKKAIIKSSQRVPLQKVTNYIYVGGEHIPQTHTEYKDVTDSLEITPHVPDDGHITLLVEAAISSKSIPKGVEQIPIVTTREISTRVRTSPGQSMIIGGIKETGKSTETESNIKGPKEKSKEVLFIILTPTIITPTPKPQKKTDVPVKVKSALSADKLKQLGLAVIMYADDHDNKLPDTLQVLKPYVANEQDFQWIVNNVEYLGKDKNYQPNQPRIPVAYDKTQKEQQSGINVLFLDGHVEFLTPQRLSELDIKRAKFLIETWFLAVNKDFIENINHNADSPDEAKELFKLKSEVLAASDGSKTQSLILDDLNVNLLLRAVQAHKDAKVLAVPQVICREGKAAKISVVNVIPFFTGYTEPNNPSEKPEPKFDQVEEGITMSVKPKLTPNKNIDMEFELEITQVPSFEELKYKEKYPYKITPVQKITQATRYIARNGQTLLFWGGHKIADRQDGQTEQKDLLVLIKAHTIGSPEQDKPAMAKYPIVTEPPRTTTNIITQPAEEKSRTERRSDNEQEKTKSATEQKPQMVQKLFKLKHHDASQMAQIIRPLLSHTGHVSTDERTNSLLVIDTAENLMRIEKIIAAFDVSVAKQTVQKSFKLKYRSPSQMAQILRPLLTKTGHVSADESTGILLLIDTPENLKRIEKIIAAFDVLQAEQTVQKFFKLKYYSTSQMAQILRPLLTKTGYISADENTGNLLVIDTVENLKRIELIITEYDVPKAEQTVTEIFEIRYGDPTEIVELLKKLINGRPDTGAVIESGKEPIVLIPEPRYKWIIAKGSAENIKQIGEWIEKLDREEPVPASLEQIDQQIIKQQKILKMRQDCINNDPVVKALSENVANAEKELIVARQKFTQLHPEVLQKAEYLQLLKKRLDDRITALGKSFDDMMLPEPNLPLAPEVPLITNTWLESDMLEVLQDIASMAGIPIIPDETVVGLVTAELKDVPLDTALDIVLAGTPYVVKKTPYYYLVASAVEPLEIEKRVDSAKKLSNLGKALLIYANDHEDKYPDSLHHLSEYLNVEELKWVLANVKYLAHGKTIAVRPDAVIAYDKMLPAERKGTNVLFNDSHVEFVKPERLKELGISATAILISTQLLSVSEDFLKDIGLDANSISSSNVWSEHLVADSAAEPNSETYSLILDDLHISFLLKAVGAHKGARGIASPQVLCQEGKTASITVLTEEYYVLGYTEPNRPSDEPEPKKDKVEIGTRIWLKPELTPDNENVRLDFKLEIRQLIGYEERGYKGKYKYIVPLTEVVSTHMQLVVPDGKTLLIGGLKIIEQVKKEPRAPRLKDLPLIGVIFSSNDKIKDHKMLLVLVKPIINPQQKARKILRGQEDSEEHIKSLARQLEKKLNRPAEPK